MVLLSRQHATAGDSEGIIGLHVSHSSRDLPINSSNSFGCVAAVACARLPAVPGLSAAASSSAFPSFPSAYLAVVAHARSTPMHDAHNSWSDTGRVQGPTGRRCTKGGVSSLAEDLRPVSKVEAGVNFRPAGGVRRQVAGSIPRRQPGTGTRQGKGSVVTPSLHPKVPGIQFVSPGYGLDIRQWVGVISLGGAPLSLPSFVTPQFQEFFRLGRVLRTTLPTSQGGVVRLFYCLWLSGSGGGC